MDDAIRALARDAGIAIDWVDATDRPQRVTIGSLRSILSALGLPNETSTDIAESRERLVRRAGSERSFVSGTVGRPIVLQRSNAKPELEAELFYEGGGTARIALRETRGQVVAPAVREPGYHRLQWSDRSITLAVAPSRCVTVADLAPGQALYGLAVQLYALGTGRHDGVGDAGALAEFAAHAARAGADAIALSPVHSLFAADPRHYSPYSPSNRMFLNPLFADPALLFGEERVATLRADDTKGDSGAGHAGLIDWPTVARDRYALLRRLFDVFTQNDLRCATPLAADFESFMRAGGDRLHEHAVFEAVHEHRRGADRPGSSWTGWPVEWRRADAPAIAHFARAEVHSVQFHMFLQWVAARSFAATQGRARAAGMRIGLIADLAIGMNPAGSHAWSRQGDLLLDLSVGAPPDAFNTRGQDWGLTAFSPQALAASGFEPFIATLRAAMGMAGGVRIDHVMGLTRLWLIPRGARPDEGAYIAYPVEDLLRVTALESVRHRAIVIGEDLGTVPSAFRARLSRWGIAGMDVLWFQRKDEEFLLPNAWRSDAVAMTTTHDLPTFAGWWQGSDIATRAALGLADEARELAQRERDRAALWRAFRKTGVAAGDEPKESAPALDAGLAFTAQSPAPLALIPVEDILGLTEQPNLPGTIDEHPNWRRRLDKPSAGLLDAPQVRARLKTMRER